MGGNGKRYVVLEESRETFTVTRMRPVFRKIYCPHCGSDTHLFQRDDDDPSEGNHTLLCERHNGEIGDVTEAVPPKPDQDNDSTIVDALIAVKERTGDE